MITQKQLEEMVERAKYIANHIYNEEVYYDSIEIEEDGTIIAHYSQYLGCNEYDNWKREIQWKHLEMDDEDIIKELREKEEEEKREKLRKEEIKKALKEQKELENKKIAQELEYKHYLELKEKFEK